MFFWLIWLNTVTVGNLVTQLLEVNVMGTSPSCPSPSPSPGDSKKYTKELLYYAVADRKDGPVFQIHASELRGKMEQLVDLEEGIERVELWCHPINGWLTGDHLSVIFETKKKRWWSIEKNNECVIIQRSKKKEAVAYQLQHTPRPVIDSSMHAWEMYNPTEDDYFIRSRMMGYLPGKSSVGDLIDILYEENLVGKDYHWNNENCQDFAYTVWKALTGKNHWECLRPD